MRTDKNDLMRKIAFKNETNEIYRPKLKKERETEKELDRRNT